VRTSIEPLELKEFSDSLKTPTFKDLQELKLDFAESQCIRNETVAELGDSLQSLEKLKRLTLDFTKCSMIGEKKEGVQFSLVPLIPKSVVLESFEIILRECKNIQDQHLAELGMNLCKFQNRLGLLHINLAECHAITAENFEKGCYWIQHDMKKLHHLTLNFYDFSYEKSRANTKTKVKKIFKEVPIFTLY